MKVVRKGSVGLRVIGVKSSGQRRVGDLQQQVVLPEAERKGDPEDGERDDDPGPQLVEVLDERQPVLRGDGLDPGHPCPSAALVGDYLALDRLGGLGLGLGGHASPAPAREPCRRCRSSSSSWSPLIEPRNSRIPLPRERPSSGQALGAEDDERDDQHDQDFEWSDIRHGRDGNAGPGRSDQARPQRVRTCRLPAARLPRSSGRSGSGSAPPGPGTCCRCCSEP